MRLFLDSCVIIESISSQSPDVLTILRHLRNKDVELVSSITVMGECIDQCKKKGFDPLALLDFLRLLEITITYPTDDLRLMCLEVDEHHESIGRYGSSFTDRTHFAYAIVAECDYFLTSAGEVRTLDCPPFKDGRKRTKAVTIAEVRRSLKQPSRGEIVISRSSLLLPRKDEITSEASTA